MKKIFFIITIAVTTLFLIFFIESEKLKFNVQSLLWRPSQEIRLFLSEIYNDEIYIIADQRYFYRESNTGDLKLIWFWLNFDSHSDFIVISKSDLISFIKVENYLNGFYLSEKNKLNLTASMYCYSSYTVKSFKTDENAIAFWSVLDNEYIIPELPKEIKDKLKPGSCE
ncbi:hypothetical protein [Idiomarina xiamenensis]|uniref:Uncharacterized protein n=1 Tax=Idiomarina xiamenensis 10-D-4 TaxID=740709 RepID=K2JSY3_9GAMM|nr:hypothetical protein [Idiomarina xiamenensis]EKE77607.1 hypothetical protein A10D4_13446 [Idiomarina xiamenensis 10-D-4]